MLVRHKNYLLIFERIPYSIECPYFPFRLYIGDDTCFFFLPFGLCQHGTWKTMPFIIIRFVRAPATTHAWKTSLKREEENILWQLGQSLLKRWEEEEERGEKWLKVGTMLAGCTYLGKVQLNPMKWLESCMRQMNTYFGQFHDLTFNLICNLR